MIDEYNLPYRTIDHLTNLLKQVFPDSKIAQQISLKRTKATATASSVIGATEKEKLGFRLRKSKFSIITTLKTKRFQVNFGLQPL